MDLHWRILSSKELLALKLQELLNRYYTPWQLKKVITYPSSSTSQNRFTPLQPNTPFFYPRPAMQLLQPVGCSSKAIQQSYTPLQTQFPTGKTPEKLPFYTPPPSQGPCPFKEKPGKLPFFTIESDYCQNNGSLLQTIAKYYPPGFHYEPKAPEKTRTFYEFILVDTKSIDLNHQYDPKDPTQISFSKFKILKVLSPSHWKAHPSVTRSFSRRFTPQHYNYYDYMDAQYYMLYQEPFNHTWFIWFKKDIPLNFPQWFVHWFIDTGINTTVFPEYAVKAFEVFTNENTFPKHMQLISFCASFGINWITSWSYGTEKL